MSPSTAPSSCACCSASASSAIKAAATRGAIRPFDRRESDRLRPSMNGVTIRSHPSALSTSRIGRKAGWVNLDRISVRCDTALRPFGARCTLADHLHPHEPTALPVEGRQDLPHAPFGEQPASLVSIGQSHGWDLRG